MQLAFGVEATRPSSIFKSAASSEARELKMLKFVVVESEVWGSGLCDAGL